MVKSGISGNMNPARMAGSSSSCSASGWSLYLLSLAATGTSSTLRAPAGSSCSKTSAVAMVEAGLLCKELVGGTSLASTTLCL